MAAPLWITSAGSLGIAVELKPFSFDLEVATGADRAEFAVISGKLPPGLILTPHGNVRGYPIGKLSGVPLDVNEETRFEFVVRCTNERGELADRTFSITVTGEDPPVPRTAPYANRNLGSFSDGTWVEVSVTGFDPDPGDTLSYKIVGGSLPPGLTLNDTGVITGYALALPENFDSKTYNFDVVVTDGKVPVIATYNIIINRAEIINAGTAGIYTDSSLIDRALPNHVPVLINRSLDLDTVVDENYYFYRLEALDFDGDTVGYEILPIVRTPTVTSDLVTVALTPGEQFSIDGYSVILTDTTVAAAADAVNNASIPGVTAEANNGRLLLYTTNSSIELLDVDGTPLADMGISPLPLAASRNADDVDPGYVTENLDEILPQSLTVNRDTGWIHGFIEPIATGERTYTFLVRVYKKAYEVSHLVKTVDYVTDYPHNILDGANQNVLLNLGLDVSGTDFDGKTIVFATQENFAASYTGIDSSTYSTGVNDGWGAGPIPGWTESSQSTSTSILNQRAGVWQFSKSGSVYNLVFQEEIQQGTEVLAVKYTGTGVNGYLQHYRKFVYQTGSNWDITGTVDGATVASNYVKLVLLNGIEVGMTVTLPDASTRTVADVNEITRIITLSSSATLADQATLTFSSGQTVPKFTQQHTVNPYGSAWIRRLTVTSSYNYFLNWITGSDLGAVTSGMPCKFTVTASNLAGSAVEYHIVSTNHKTVNGNHVSTKYIRLDSVDNIVTNMRVSGGAITGYPVIVSIDYDNNIISLSNPVTVADNTVLYFHGTDLPRGLQLRSNGEIEGRPSHQHFVLQDNTTFDTETTTFDRNYIVNVQARAYLNDPIKREIDTIKTFTFSVLDYKRKPSSNFYLEFLLTDHDRQQIQTAIKNDRIIPDEYIYRIDDHWFGRQRNVRMLVAYGLDTATDNQVVGAVAAYHYKKKYIFRNLKWAQSVDSNGNVEYEVIYIDPVDQFTTLTGNTITGDVPVANYLIDTANADSTVWKVDTDLIDSSAEHLLRLYPASLANMQNRLKQLLSPSNRRFLPTWMTSVQPDGRILNFTQAIPLVYLKPGHGKLALYKLQQTLDVSGISAQVDRYAWDDGLALNYDKVNDRFYDNEPTTFDQEITPAADLNIVDTVDFAVDAAFVQINNVSSYDLIRNGLVDNYRGSLDGKTLIFFNQELFSALDDFADIDGWANVDPQYDHRAVTVSTRTVISNVTVYVDTVASLSAGMKMTGQSITGSPAIVSVDLVNNSVTLDQAQTVVVGQMLSFTSPYDITNYEGYHVVPGYNEVLLMGATTASVVVKAQVVGDINNTTVIPIDNFNGVAVGQTVTGAGITGTPVVDSIDLINNTVTLDGAQTLPDGTVLTFTGSGNVTGTDFVMSSLFGIADGQTVTGAGISGSPTVTGIDYLTRSITLSTTQTIANQTSLTFVRTLAAAWSPSTSYNMYDIVLYAGKYYMCVTDTGPDAVFPADRFALINLPQAVYQRAGIWRMQEDSGGVVTLEFVKALNFAGAPYESVKIRSGLRHGGQTLSLVEPAMLGLAYTVPGFIDQQQLITTGNATIFDDRTTEFFGSATDLYLNPDEGTKYIRFSRDTILDRGIVDV